MTDHICSRGGRGVGQFSSRSGAARWDTSLAARTVRSDLFPSASHGSNFEVLSRAERSGSSSSSSSDDDSDITAETIYRTLDGRRSRSPPSMRTAAGPAHLRENGSIVMSSVPQSTNPVTWNVSSRAGNMDQRV